MNRFLDSDYETKEFDRNKVIFLPIGGHQKTLGKLKETKTKEVQDEQINRYRKTGS